MCLKTDTPLQTHLLLKALHDLHLFTHLEEHFGLDPCALYLHFGQLYLHFGFEHDQTGLVKGPPSGSPGGKLAFLQSLAALARHV